MKARTLNLSSLFICKFFPTKFFPGTINNLARIKLRPFCPLGLKHFNNEMNAVAMEWKIKCMWCLRSEITISIGAIVNAEEPLINYRATGIPSHPVSA